MSKFTYLDDFAHVQITDEDALLISEGVDDDYTLMDLHENTGYTNHAQSGCTTHANTGCTTHANTGCVTHVNTGCATHADSGCNTHSDTGYDNYANAGCNTHSESYCYVHYQGVNCTDKVSTYSNCVAGDYTAYGDFNECSPHGYQTVCSQSGYSNHGDTGCSTHSDTGYDNHSNSGYTDHSNTGYTDHVNSGYNDHSNVGYTDHVNTGYNNHINYTDNYDPVITGVVSTDGATSYHSSIPLSWPAATDTLASGQTAQTITYYLYYKKKGGDGMWGIWESSFANTTSLTYNWNVLAMAAGEYIVKVRAWDGLEWNNEGTSDPNDPLSIGIESSVLVIIHYVAPSWTEVLEPGLHVKQQHIGEVRVQTNEAEKAYSLTETVFDTSEYTKVVHITELRTAGQGIYTAAGKGTFGWTDVTLTVDETPIETDEVQDIRTLLENI